MAAPSVRNARPSLVFGRTTLLRGVGEAGARSPGTLASARSPMLNGASERTVAAIILLWRSAASLLTVIEPGERVAFPATGAPGISVEGEPRGCPTQRSAAAAA